MVVAATNFYKALSDPLQALQDLYEKEGDKENFPNSVASHFQSLFADQDARAKITPLTRSLLQGHDSNEAGRSNPPARLVRWRCMIQDTNLGSEMMLRRYKNADGVWKNGLFGAATLGDETDSSEEDVNTNQLSSLDTLYAVSLPGQTKWSQLADERLDSEMEGDMLNKLESTSISQSQDELNFIKGKLPTGQEMGVLLKVYDEELAASVRVAQAVDVIGILDQSPLPEGHWSSPDGDESSSALFPAIHVIAMQKTVTDNTDILFQDQSEIREALIATLAQVLQGDKLAAEWLLLSLIARIHTRTASHIVGPLSLNISSYPASSETPLFNLLSDLLPLVVSQSLELTHLNDTNTSFSPKGQADEAGLKAGRLQLVDGTLLLIDENSMQEGQLRERGIENIKTLSNLLTSRKLTYTFPYSNLEMDVDVNCVILSQGKSFLPFDVQIPLQSVQVEADTSSRDVDTGSSSRSQQYSTPDFRRYLASVQSQSSQAKQFTITSDISDRIQTDFVDMRHGKKESKSSLMESREDLSRIIHVARLLCLSRGGAQLTWKDWERAKSLDAQRLNRL